MRQETAARITLAGLAAIMSLALYSTAEVRSLSQNVTRSLTDASMQSLETTVTQTSTGFTIKVITPRNTDDTDATHVARHKSLCNAAKDG